MGNSIIRFLVPPVTSYMVENKFIMWKNIFIPNEWENIMGKYKKSSPRNSSSERFSLYFTFVTILA